MLFDNNGTIPITRVIDTRDTGTYNNKNIAHRYINIKDVIDG